MQSVIHSPVNRNSISARKMSANLQTSVSIRDLSTMDINYSLPFTSTRIVTGPVTNNDSTLSFNNTNSAFPTSGAKVSRRAKNGLSRHSNVVLFST